jgi:GT2 family glycosyltransferase
MYSAYHWFSTPEALFSHSGRFADLASNLQPILGETRYYYGDIFGPMILGSLVHTSTVLVRRERYEHVKFFREELAPAGEDYDFHLRTCRAGKVAFLNKSAILYQVGRPDQLTRPEFKLTIAINSLRTIEPFLKSERQRINLPDWMIRETLAVSHYCLSEHYLTMGCRKDAIRHFFLSLRYKPWQPRVYAFIPMTFLPMGLTDGLRKLYRTCKTTVKSVFAMF